MFFLIAAPCFADFRFAVIGDTRDYSSGGVNVKTMRAILEKIKSEKPDFIVVTGDMITGSTKSRVHANRLKKWKGVIEKYGIPYYICVGNHEIESEMSENIIRSVFEMPENGPTGFKELAYTFDYKNAHFVTLDTEAFNNFHAVGEEQLKWLKEGLEKNQKRIIFIFGHDPAYPVHDHIGSSLDKYSAQRDELWGIFKQYKVSAYFCGHEHLYNRSIYDGIYQIITGGGGAPISAPEGKGGFNNFIVVDVKDNGTVNITTKDIDGFIQFTVTNHHK
jgi:3',5'-cyclic AMP phosphodiesterase CpdA